MRFACKSAGIVASRGPIARRLAILGDSLWEDLPLQVDMHSLEIELIGWHESSDPRFDLAIVQLKEETPNSTDCSHYESDGRGWLIWVE